MIWSHLSEVTRHELSCHKSFAIISPVQSHGHWMRHPPYASISSWQEPSHMQPEAQKKISAQRTNRFGKKSLGGRPDKHQRGTEDGTSHSRTQSQRKPAQSQSTITRKVQSNKEVTLVRSLPSHLLCHSCEKTPRGSMKGRRSETGKTMKLPKK